MTFKKLIWPLWILLTVAIGGYYGYVLLASEDKSDLLIGQASHGHFQIELACDSCHTDAFGGEEVLQDACVNCHAEELEDAHDSHPKKKFIDPREAYRLEIIDARYCVSCHTEHQAEQTREMGVTLPDDYCWHCHKEVGDERESHKDLAFDSCASAGCHNFHDNRALFESFLTDNANKSWLTDLPQVALRNHASLKANRDVAIKPQQEAVKMAEHPDVVEHWQGTAHANAGISCTGCHAGNEESEWIEKPGIESCASCHEQEFDGWSSGKHGMRLSNKVAAELSPMSASQSSSDLTFDPLNAHVEQGCNSCHKPHEYDTQFASVDACLTCHQDDHSTAFKQSPHGELWLQSAQAELPVEQAVTCATCHLPRVSKKQRGEVITHVEHNQNYYLRPNEKMIRPVCMQCHSLEFSIDALADPNLIRNNFSGKPGRHIESIDWALKRQKK
ncbi:cytochrome c3 family protein [Echinimonas agarilytica]|uniref:nitrite reductase (cytochrome; ammonia-forming) n=1 Tax=Echinimonas agarilytica TaxID=1215918 RepID=A0AA41W740_9GAMM|nr:cytochrome c3 family protein [Echinimonas agarilytica]MCM2680089.1 cytochrome c3 family protein [Echinimonas agarilytica]